MDELYPSVEQAIGRDRVRKALRRYENRPSADVLHGLVRSVNADGSYEVLLSGDVQPTRCGNYCEAYAGDVVSVVRKTDGACDAVGRLGGEVKPVILYSNESGTTGTVTLSDSAENYSFIDIVVSPTSGNVASSVRVYQPEGKTVDANSLLVGSAGWTGLYTARYVISGRTVAPSFNYRVSSSLNGTAAFHSDFLYCVAVIGYK